MTSFSPREIVSELDRFIVGQKDAKRAVAIALRNRWRRQQLADDLKEEVLPKNILMIGPTGCGKTEISRRLARLAGAPFIKVEATKFTEVGYVGRDVDSIVRDLVEVGIGLVRETKRKEVRAQAEKNAEERVLDALVGAELAPATRESFPQAAARQRAQRQGDRDPGGGRRPAAAVLRHPGRPGRHDQPQRHAGQGVRPAHEAAPDDRGQGLRRPGGAGERQAARPGCSSSARPSAASRTTASCSSTRSTRSARAREGGRIGADVSREGVQRDLLPLIEGTTVSTKYGPVKTDHVLFIASGAFHVRPSRRTCCPSCRAGCRSAWS